MAPSSSAATTSVQVALRIRPTTPQDATSIPARFQRAVIHSISNQAVAVDATPSTSVNATGTTSNTASLTAATGPSKKQIFSFDQVHGPDTTQHHLFSSTAEPLISRFLEGFNCTILAYGQTSSGKTYSMTGVDLDADPSDPNNGMGIIPRSVSTIFSRAREIKDERGGSWNYSIKGSFIELYNEDLIDLLSDDTSAEKREVQIREDKDGHIIWGGLKEVNVRTSHEVMNLIRQGTAIRRTNETDMNAQSSRSHAIFSLTLTQKKYTGSGSIPRSTTPVPPGGRSPSRLARPVSSLPGASRVASPTFGRPPTPSFAVAMSRGSSLRPASALGSHAADNRPRNTEEDVGDWITIVSKFHFVDLAGSERLKRTAAAGERIREGISINSGLLALGNVISALGDPARAKSHTASHVPYRDSKLTRLLQDSLGGNAHTLMIACVSPAEWNAGETVNTLKYANRARNIKNRAIVTEKEEGWDDAEWLQNMVTRLRKELKALKESGAVGSTATKPQAEPEGASKKVVAQMVQLQSNYEDLRAKFVERTEELTRLRRELGEKHRNSANGAIGGTSKYEEIVGPVIEEYEKTISAMEAELSLNRAALRHTNDLVEEKEEELAIITERHSATEMYVEELKSRVVKLSEREASTEAYIRDLEEKIKHHEDISMNSHESVTDFKREIARHKGDEQRTSEYIADLENRLARSDQSILSLRETIDKLEREADLRRAEVTVLQERLENVLDDGEGWRSDLEIREKKLKELELQMEEWEARRIRAGEDRIRIGNLVDGVREARRSLEADVAKVSAAHVNGVDNHSSEKSISGDNSLESQLATLQETHAATLSDLSSVTAKYRDALKEISDLAAQISEAKISSPSRSESPDRLSEVKPLRRGVSIPKLRDLNDTSRRPFFRQAASSESLHSRSQSQSQSLSQELFSARSRKKSFSGTNGTNSPTMRSGSFNSRPNLSISLPLGSTSPSERSVSSLEKEIMRLQEVLEEREAEIGTLEKALKDKEQNVSGAPELVNGHSQPLAEDLPEQTKEQFDAIRRSMELRHPIPEGDSSPDDSLVRLNELMLSMAQKESLHREVVEELNDELARIRRQHDDLSKLSRDQALNMSTELEAARREHNDALVEMENLRQKELLLSEEKQAAEEDYLKAIESLRSEHEQVMRNKQNEMDSLISRINEEHAMDCKTLRDQLAEAAALLSKHLADHEEAFGKLKASHEEEVQRLQQRANDTLKQTEEAHKVILNKAIADHQKELDAKINEHITVLHHTEEEYYAGLSKLRTDHGESLAQKESEYAAEIARLKEDHASQLRMAEIAREGTLSESQAEQASVLKQLQDEHTSAMERREAAHSEELRRLGDEHSQSLANKDEQYKATLKKLKADHSAKLNETEVELQKQLQDLNSALAESLRLQTDLTTKYENQVQAKSQELQEKHDAALQEIERSHASEINRLKADYASARAQADAAHEDANLQLRKQLSEEIAKLRKEHQQESLKLASEIATSQEQHKEEIAKLKKEHQQDSLKLASEVATSQEQHKDEIVKLKKEHEQESLKLALEIATSQEQHREEIMKLKKEHHLETTKLSSESIAAQERHKESFEEFRAQQEAILAENENQFSKSLADLEEVHTSERDILKKDYDLVVEELAAYKAASDEAMEKQEQINKQYEHALQDKDSAIHELRENLHEIEEYHANSLTDIEKLQKELELSRKEQERLKHELAHRNSVFEDLERHKSLLADVQNDLQRTRDHRDTVISEKNKQDNALRELQGQLSRSMSPSSDSHIPRPSNDRSLTYSRIPSAKLPPLTPPPSVPPPPAPKAVPQIPTESAQSIPSHNTAGSSISSRDSQLDSPSTTTSATHSVATAQTTVIETKLEEQAKHIEEQDTMIKTLNKQLTHCESDLQAHIDLVSTLETSLADSEKNLRKARMHATELARERDTLNGQVQTLRHDLEESRKEVVNVRRSIVEEKQSLETKLDEERKAKERARAQLDSRVEEIQKRKSKFVCL